MPRGAVCFLSGHLLRRVGQYAMWGGMHRRRYAFYPATSYTERGGMPLWAVCIVDSMLSIWPPPTQSGVVCHVGRYASSTVCFLSGHLPRRVGQYATWGGRHRQQYAFYPATSYAEWGGMPRGAVCIVDGMLSIWPPPAQSGAVCHVGR